MAGVFMSELMAKILFATTVQQLGLVAAMTN